MKLQKTPNNQNSHEKEEQIWRYHDPWFQIILQRLKEYSTGSKTDT